MRFFFFHWLAGFVFVVFLFVNHVVRAVDMISCFVYFSRVLFIMFVFLFFCCLLLSYRPACLAVVGYSFFFYSIVAPVVSRCFILCVCVVSSRDIRLVCVCCGAWRQFIYVFLFSLLCALVLSCSSLLVIV